VKTEILYGFHPVHEALAAQRRTIYEIYLQNQTPSGRLARLAALSAASGIQIKAAGSSDLRALAGTAGHMDNRIVLDIGRVTNRDRIDISSNCSIEPDARMRADSDVPDDFCRFGNKGFRTEFGIDSAITSNQTMSLSDNFSRHNCAVREVAIRIMEKSHSVPRNPDESKYSALLDRHRRRNGLREDALCAKGRFRGGTRQIYCHPAGLLLSGSLPHAIQ